MSTLKNIFSLEKRPVSFRVNTIKWTVVEVEEELQKNNILYSKTNLFENSYILDSIHSEKDLWNLEIYKDGKIYLQGISSQFPIHFFDTQNSKNLKILDACAAPGWKTSQLAEKYPDADIWAFEPSKIRYDKMCHNLKKLWCENIKTIHDSIENISQHIDTEEYFDLILIDAPCSWEWALNIYNEKFLEAWDITHIHKNYKRQKRICKATLPYLKSGGEFIYSTCTLAPEENEAVIHFLLCNNFKLELKNIDLKDNTYITLSHTLKTFEKYYFKKEISEYCLRIIPDKHTEGFFIAKLRKECIEWWSESES